MARDKIGEAIKEKKKKLADASDIAQMHGDDVESDQIEQELRQENSYIESHKLKQLDLGWLGKLLGGGKEKTSNITGAVLFLSFLSLLLFMFLDVSVDKDLLRYAVSGVISIITLSLGYLFGRRQ